MRVVHIKRAAASAALAVGVSCLVAAAAGATGYQLTLNHVAGDYSRQVLTECGKTGHYHFYHATPGAGIGHRIEVSGGLAPSLARFKPVLHFLKCVHGRYVGAGYITLTGSRGNYSSSIDAKTYTRLPATTYYRIFTTYGGARSAVHHLAITR